MPSLSPDNTDGIYTEVQAPPTNPLLEAGPVRIQITRVGPANASDDDREDRAALEPAPVHEAPETHDSSTHLVDIADSPPHMSTMRDSDEAPAVNDFPRDKDRNVREPTLHTTRSRTPPDIVDDSRSEAVIDEATPGADATASLLTRDEDQGPFPRDPDTTRHGYPPMLPEVIVPDNSSRDTQHDHDNGRNSSVTSGVIFDDADSQAKAGADGGLTRSYGAMTLTPKPSSLVTRNDVDLPPESAPPENVHDGLLDICPLTADDSQQAMDFAPPSDISDTGDTVNISETRDSELTFDTAHSERGRGAVRDDDRLQLLDGGDDVVPREGVEDEEDT
ncbi:hypothetical protein BDW22DRAFT_1362890 [Trametopsis cervina]|nr:hypothetical protein BDW22DRAFT_1362890 [Trametopsis cervina]